MIGSSHDKNEKDQNGIFGKIFKITFNKELISYTKNNIQFINFLENYIDSEDWAEINCDFYENDDDLDDESTLPSDLNEELYEGASISISEFVLSIALMKSSLNQLNVHTAFILKLFSKVQ